jgi:acyl-[acyl-carrier-protein]-phospholipid O-acyltransferase / long-chain-fatty-acid--[acyl-carrier-protein] ligase
VTKTQTSNTGHQTPNSTRGFWALIVTQFQGAFSDNALKQLALFLGISLGMNEHQQDRLSSLTMALLTVPFIFFSMFGGSLATRCSKRSVMIGVKVFEILIMAVATFGLARQSLPVVLFCVLFMGIHSAVFGPSKYGSLPELLAEKKLSWGNGILELGTFLAIILGTQAGGILSLVFEGTPMWAGLILISLAISGLAASAVITRVPAADPQLALRFNFVGDLLCQWRRIRQDRVLRLAVIGNTFFWFLATILFLNLFAHGRFALNCDKLHLNYLIGALSIGIGVGSVAAGYLSGGKIEYGLVPPGLAGLTLFSALLALLDLEFTGVFWHLAALGFFAGIFVVPVNAIMQHRPRKEERGSILAAANLISSAGSCLAAGVWAALRIWPHDTHMIFLAGAMLTLGALVYSMVLMPDALLRFVLWLLTRTLYQIRVDGRDNIPEKGGALFVCNHASWMDALLLIASTDRQIRFLMFKDIYEKPLVNWGARILGVIPISSEQRPRELIQSLQAASDAIRKGEVVCIFAEGQITRIGQLLPFRRGMERIMKDVDAPIVPVALDGVMGSISSYEHHRFIWKWPRKIPYPVTVSFGAPLPPTATPFQTRQAVQELLASAWRHRRDRMKPLHRQFVRTARKFPLRFAMADAQNKKVTFGAALVKTVFLARRLKKVWVGQEMVGILLPPSVPGALVNYAALLCGKVPVNLNYTLSEAALASCAKQCELKTVITSRTFLEKIKLTVPGGTIFLEDLAAKPALSEKLLAFLAATFLPVKLLECALEDCRRRRKESWAASVDGQGRPPDVGSYEEKEDALDSLATVIFSSGSTGEPKGVMLSHYNIGANIEQMDQVFDLNRHDRFLGILPFFHSFGFTGTLCLPAALGVGVVFHPNPLDAKTIGPLVKHHAVTYLLATPTFLQIYLRGCAPADFGSLRLVMTAAEKMPDRLATAFEARFGIRPMEGYGCTECAPTVAVNTPDFRSAGFHQVGAKRGTIGHPLPGVCVRVVDPENPWNGTPLPLGQAGLLLVRGPNVMLGYLGKPEKTAEVLRAPERELSQLAAPPKYQPLRIGDNPRSADEAKWYCTGDVAALDEDGFLQITDRLNRFSKIGGEMVPHIKVEEILHDLAGVTELTFVVAGVPDETKSERLVVLHKLANEQLQACLEKFAACDLPNLWKPKADSFFRVEQFPLLGTGKLDLRKVKEVAAQLAG